MPSSLTKIPIQHRIVDEGETWVTTEEMCALLKICRSTLYRVRTAEGRMEEGVHFVRKNPMSIRCGHLFWNPKKVEEVFRRRVP